MIWRHKTVKRLAHKRAKVLVNRMSLNKTFNFILNRRTVILQSFNYLPNCFISQRPKVCSHDIYILSRNRKRVSGSYSNSILISSHKSEFNL